MREGAFRQYAVCHLRCAARSAMLHAWIATLDNFERVLMPRCRLQSSPSTSDKLVSPKASHL